jgi:WD40 repeat protein
VVHRLDGDPNTPGGRHVLKGHSGPVLSLAFSADGKRLFTGSIDSTIREWDLDTRKEIQIIRDHSSWVNSLATDPAGRWLASAGSDNMLQVRIQRDSRLNNIRLTNIIPVKDGEIRAVALAPNGKFVAAGIRYSGVRVWDLETNREIASFQAHAGETWAVAFTPDGKTLASGGGDWNKPGEVRLWKVETWKEWAKLQHTGEVLCLAISPDGHYLAAGSWDRTVRIWKLDGAMP